MNKLHFQFFSFLFLLLPFFALPLILILLEIFHMDQHILQHLLFLFLAIVIKLYIYIIYIQIYIYIIFKFILYKRKKKK